MKPSNFDKVTALRHELHAHPELSMEEHNTKSRLISFIKENTSLELTDCGHWFYAVYHSMNPSARTLCFRADFDAVAIKETCDLPYVSQNPGAGHKCGHDGHAAALAGFAMEIDQHGCNNNIYFLFQHAEETGQGAVECARLIDEKGIDMIFAIHNRSGYPEGTIIYRDGLTQCASRGLTIFYQGTPAHASQPETGHNPAFAIARTISYVQELLRENSFEEMVLATIIHGKIGQRNFGIAAGQGELSLTLRANREEDLDRLELLLRQKSLEYATAEQLSVSYEISDPFPETRNHSDAIHIIKNCACKLGLPLIEMPEPWRASEDFGHYTKKCSGAMFYVGNGTEYPEVHTGDYDFNDNILEIIIKMFFAISHK